MATVNKLKVGDYVQYKSDPHRFCYQINDIAGNQAYIGDVGESTSNIIQEWVPLSELELYQDYDDSDDDPGYGSEDDEYDRAELEDMTNSQLNRLRAALSGLQEELHKEWEAIIGDIDDIIDKRSERG